MVEIIHPERLIYASEFPRWNAAVVFSLALHLGGGLWLFRDSPETMVSDNPPSAIMMELAPEPQAIMTESNDISPDQQNAEFSSQQVNQPVKVESQVTDDMPSEETAIESMAEPEPSETTTPESALSPLDEMVIKTLEKVEVPFPVARPRPNRNKETVDKRTTVKPRRQDAATASSIKIQAQAQTKKSNRNAASQTSSGTISSAAEPAKWLSRLMAHLEKRKKYPHAARARGEIGTAYVRFRIDDAGNVVSSSLAASSGFSELDREVLAIVRRASPVPVPPAEANKIITAPIEFNVE